MTGRLIPENAIEFFNPIDEWINEYFCNASDITYFEIYFEYINSEGIKHLLDFFHKIIHIHLKNNKKKLKIDWYYKDGDEDILEQGTFFSSVLKVPFNFIKII
jgi:hypothetical protein